MSLILLLGPELAVELDKVCQLGLPLDMDVELDVELALGGQLDVALVLELDMVLGYRQDDQLAQHVALALLRLLDMA